MEAFWDPPPLPSQSFVGLGKEGTKPWARPLLDIWEFLAAYQLGTSIWEFPKIGDPNIVPEIVGSV